jgi:nicotinamide-nucleotide amidase
MLYKRVAVFVIGTELTRGVIADKHCPVIASQLTRLGYVIDRMVVVPDDGTIDSVLQDCVDSCDVILLTGGLGPTSDDMTRQSVASLAEVPLVRDQGSFEHLYARIGERIWGANEQQTMIPQGFEAIANPNGTAPGFKGFVPRDERLVACAAMPGPPREMDPMFFDEVLPWLGSLRGHDDFTRDEYSTFMIPESKLEELCRTVSEDDVQWGTRFQDLKISLYLVGKDHEARKRMASRLSAAVGPSLVVEGDVMPVDLLVGELQKRHMTVSCAESCTAGYAAKLLTDRPGSSEWFWGGAVTYANEAKVRLLGVKEQTLSTDGAVSGRCVIEMAEGMRASSGTDIAFSISGIAGPSGGSEEKPVGTVWFGFAGKDRKSQAVQLRISSWGRESVRRKSAVVALLLAALYCKGDDLLDTAGKWQYI